MIFVYIYLLISNYNTMFISHLNKYTSYPYRNTTSLDRVYLIKFQKKESLAFFVSEEFNNLQRVVLGVGWFFLFCN